MPNQESILSKICKITKGTSPFCLDLDEEDSYIIETDDNSNNK